MCPGRWRCSTPARRCAGSGGRPMAPVPSKIKPRLVPGTGWESVSQRGHEPKVYARGGVFLEANIDTTCFTIRQINEGDEDDDLSHVCDWPELRATIDQFMADRAKEAPD